jgi:hypothetical protein
MKNLKFIPLGFWIFLAACSDPLTLKTSRWNQDGPVPARPQGLSKDEPPLVLGNKSMLFQSQKINGVEIEGSYYKEIGNGRPEFIVSNWALSIPKNIENKIHWMKSIQSRVKAKFLEKYPAWAKGSVYQSPEIVIQEGEPRWKIVVESQAGRLLGIYLNSNFEIQKIHDLGSSLENAAATLFPEGPLMSQLQKVLLLNLKDNKALISNSLHVMTQSNQVAVAENSQFIYPVDDRRFEQVQVFFYISKLLNWCERSLGFQLPFVLEAETSVGFPEKTNTAFYYQGRIRLGDGDDVVFSQIPLDPSIVYHESFHSFIDAVAKLPFQGEGGSLNEGFADFLTAIFTGNPNLGEASYKLAPLKRTVKNNFLFAEKNGGLYHDSGIVSGLLWSIQDSLGREQGLEIAWQTLTRLTPDSNFNSFLLELQSVISQLPAEQQKKVQAVLQKRGWIE